MLKIMSIAEDMKKSHQGSYVTENILYMKGGRSTEISFTATYNSQPIVQENQFD